MFFFFLRVCFLFSATCFNAKKTPYFVNRTHIFYIQSLLLPLLSNKKTWGQILLLAFSIKSFIWKLYLTLWILYLVLSQLSDGSFLLLGLVNDVIKQTKNNSLRKTAIVLLSSAIKKNWNSILLSLPFKFTLTLRWYPDYPKWSYQWNSTLTYIYICLYLYNLYLYIYDW